MQANNSILMRELLSQSAMLCDWKLLCAGPMQLLLPQEFDENLTELKSGLNDFGNNAAIYFAHKPTKSSVFVRKAQQHGLGIDVASRVELISALSAGFVGSRIECTGIKNETFLELALLHGCLIVLDSIPELLRLVAVHQRLALTVPAKVLVRLTDVPISGRKLKSRISRFGVSVTQLNDLFALLLKHQSQVNFAGFHIHNEKREANDRAGQLSGLLQLVVDAFNQGLTPTMINIGGGFRRQLFAQKSAWSEYLAWFEQCLVSGEPTDTWGGYSYGMTLESSGRVVGRERAVSMGTPAEMKEVLASLSTAPGPDGRSAATFFAENDLTLLLEPGTALLDNCGVTLFEVVEAKMGGNKTPCVVIDGNIYNLASQFRPYLTDPILIQSTRKLSDGSPFSGFVLGNMCREEDFMLMRKVSLQMTPQPGDLLAFPNTAAYRSDFEDARPHAHNTVKSFVALQVRDQWQLTSQEQLPRFEQLGSLLSTTL